MVAVEGLKLNATGATYSFRDVTATFVSLTTEFVLGRNSGVAEEGITITPVGEQNVMKRGAGGGWGHSMIAGTWATIKIALLQTSNANSLLQTAYEIQHQNSSLWGKNQIVIRENKSGTTIICLGCAFKNWASFPFKMEMETIEWEFDCGRIEAIRGTYQNVTV